MTLLNSGAQVRAMLIRMNVQSNRRKSRTGLKSHAPRPRGRPLVDDKRRRVLDAALKMFAARGYHGTTIPEVATAAKVGTGTLYHYFEHKQQLVNEVYRDAKLRLRSEVIEHLREVDIEIPGAAEAWYLELWRRLAEYAKREPDAFKFLEMQDHTEYLDVESRHLELSMLMPMFNVGQRIHDRAGGARVDIVIALVWGGFVGLVKASRLGYLALDDQKLDEAGAICWRMLAPEAIRAASKPPPKPPRGKRGNDEGTR